ncbi:hypothetical protein DCC39_07655 [Pueribacillus theae]|uniref:G5 domain-containing protein n=1 Tax=Pueribacillus theae TaxID=2171751 RepID=A0A2U1K4J7_9BACI|nr:G5 and 3D domain-containing protein [Pueribacillus theae]PWA12114.1 hypothetical protein DCC39_07655 [Pueribacillus theae]
MEANGKRFSGLLKGKKFLLILFSVIVLSVVTGFSVYETMKSDVILSLDGKEIQVKSHANSVAEVLEEQDIDVNQHDFIEPALDAAIEDGMKVVWKPAKQVVLNIDGKKHDIWTVKDTVGDVLEERKITVKEHDKINPAQSEAIEENLEIQFESAFEIPLVIGDKEKKVWTTSTTVADLLKEQKVELNELDRVEPGKDEEVSPETKINVVRVEKVTDVVEEAVAFATVTKKDGSLSKGKEKVIDEGQKGKVKKHYEVILENGKEVKRKLVKEEKVKDSKNRIVAVGTKEVPKTVSRKQSASSNEPSAQAAAKAPSGGKTIYMSSTAYTANCSGCSGVTATGVNLKANPGAKVVAVDPNVIPLGTKVHVEGYGYAIAADTGGAIKGNRIDVFVPSNSKATSWGRKNVKVKIVD